MRVLHVIPSISEKAGGPSQAIFPMCRALKEQDIEVVLATTNDGLDKQLTSAEPVNDNKVHTLMFPAQAGSSFKYSRPFSTWLDESVSEFDVVHIHAVFNHSCIAAARACRKSNVPYVVRPLGTLDPWSMRQKPLRKKVFWHAGIKRMLSAAAAIHYTTQAEQDAVESSLGLNHGCVIPLGVDMEDHGDAARLDEHFPELSGRRYVLVLSRLHPKKGLDVLQDAFLSLKQEDEFKDALLVLAGDGDESYVEFLKTRIQHRPQAQSIILTGWLTGPRKAAVLRNASLLALPSRQENFGVCVMEALACGVPVLVSPQVNLAEQIATAGAGWIVEIDETKLKTSLREALRGQTERTLRGNAGRELAKHFSWPNTARQLSELYQSIAKISHQAAVV